MNSSNKKLRENLSKKQLLNWKKKKKEEKINPLKEQKKAQKEIKKQVMLPEKRE